MEEKAAAGRRALSAWLNRCKTEVGDVGVGIFKKLMSTLGDSTMLYGVEIWGCMRSIETIEQVYIQLGAFRMFFGVPEGIIDDGDGVSASSVGGKSEVCAAGTRY